MIPALRLRHVVWLAGLAACTPAQQGVRPHENLPPPPKPVGLKPGEINPEAILKVGRAQAYDENPGASHESILDEGTRAVIEPQEGVWQLDSTTLARGIVVARFRNLSKVALPRLGLLPETTTYWYIWRDDKGLQSAYIPDSPDRQTDVIGVPTIIHPPTRPWRQSIAQWQLKGVLRPHGGMGAGAVGVMNTESGSVPWITCIKAGCCSNPT